MEVGGDGGWQLVVALGVISFLADFVYALLGFGPSICFQLGWQASFLAGVGSGSLTDAGKFIAIQSMGMAILQSILQRNNADFRLACYLGVPSLILSFVGVRLLLVLDSIWLKRSLGLVFLLLSLKNAHKMWKQAKQQQQQQQQQQQHSKGGAAAEDADLHAPLIDTSAPLIDTSAPLIDTSAPLIDTSAPLIDASAPLIDASAAANEETEFGRFGWRIKLVVIMTGGASGLMGGLYSVAGPPLMVMVASYNLDHMRWRGTSAVFRLFLALARVTAFGTAHIGRGGTSLYSWDDWPLYTVMIAASAAGVVLGNAAAPLVPVPIAKRSILALLMSASVLMLVSGSGVVWEEVGLGVVLAIGVVGTAGAAWWCRSTPPAEPAHCATLGDGDETAQATHQ
jgi:uncharacterized membrane protein YfcA